MVRSIKVPVSFDTWQKWYKREAIPHAVKLQGDVKVLVRQKDFRSYMKNPHTPHSLLTIAMYENWDMLVERYT